MASPASSSGEGQKKNMEQITFRFCSEWYAGPSQISRPPSNNPIVQTCCTPKKIPTRTAFSSPAAHANIPKKQPRLVFSATCSTTLWARQLVSRRMLDRIQLWVYLSVCCAAALLCVKVEYKTRKWMSRASRKWSKLLFLSRRLFLSN